MLSQLLSLKHARVLVVGDVMIDSYISGVARRLSPEAPVPVVTPAGRWTMPGGAANVASNIASLGSTVGLICALNSDSNSTGLRATLETNGVEVHLLPSTRPIPVKTRIRTDLQHIVRIDEEDTSAHNLDREVVDLIKTLIDDRRYNVILVSDYEKGLISEDLVRSISAIGQECQIPVLTDPKKSDPAVYRDVSLLKPNVKEALGLLNSDSDITTASELSELADKVRRATRSASVVVTGGSLGCSLADSHGVLHFPPPPLIQVADVSGAGDTFISFVAAGLSVGHALSNAVQLATIAATVSCTAVGTSPVALNDLVKVILGSGTDTAEKFVADQSLDEVAKVLPRPVVFTNGCFDVLHPGHIASLEFARRQGGSLVVACNSDDSVYRLKGEGRPLQSFQERSRTLCALSATTIVCELKDDTPLALIERVRPDVLVKGSDYEGKNVVGQEFVESYGGRVILSPIVSGFSTTSFVNRVSS